MIPSQFDYELAGTVDEAVGLLSQHDDAKLLAGGHSLLPLMRLRFASPALLIDIGRLSELSYIKEADGSIAIGALTRHHDLAGSDVLRERCAVIAETAEGIGDPQVRHRGTIGGSVTHSDPASDLPTVLLALEAEMVARGPSGERAIAAADFFTGFLESALGDNEILKEIRVPAIGSAGAYVKFNRRAQDWATVGVAAVRLNGATNVALTNMGATPLRAAGVEEALAAGADTAVASAQAANGTSPPSDTNGSAEYRAHLASILTKRALEALDG